MSGNVTIRDVARKAGVSISTVSRVINGTGYVRESTRKKIEDAIRALGYSPNHVARSLSKGSTKIIGAILPDISNPFFPTLARGIDDAVSSRGYTLIICNTDSDVRQEESSVRVLLEKRVDGVVFVAGSPESASLVRRASEQVPVAVIDREVEGVPCDTVTVDNFRGSYELTRYLLNCGHRKMAYISGPLHLSTSKKRLAGFRACLRDSGVNDEPHVFHGDFKYDTGYSIAREIIRMGLGITCVVCANDLMAIGAMRCFQDLGIGVPSQVAVCGFDDITMASLVRPSLTTVAQPAYRMGALAAEMLLERIEKGRDQSPRSRVLEPVLVIRDSTGGGGVKA
ncbi:MAG TPA: LacI family transcriptional regulator [Firmicutes bacterium]|uniref:LacI family DNA-binding transcriptional regulator n=1 Tax=Candidatus Fermentithermobacillus carboniphilus TaxID=3085328 RepID=A0AAT9LG47_9FIRM|nr:MAG: LacI family DNA-binding transcriptional regulator [Candidatus Fermentithermobacillus carboniphilus]HHW17541.1 LacI family transcriptional regulator [Candidatus Fermentithermobacillaceae bacterium]